MINFYSAFSRVRMDSFGLNSGILVLTRTELLLLVVVSCNTEKIHYMVLRSRILGQ